MISSQSSPDGDAPLRLFDQSGIVVFVNTWSETDVSGVVWSNGGHVSTSKTEVMQIFMQQDDGSEIDLKINNTAIGARAGHYLSIVWAQNNNSSSKVGVAIVNHHTGRYEVFKNRVDQVMGKPIANLNGCFFAVVTIIAAMIFAPFLGELASILIPLAMLAIPISLVFSVGNTKGHRRAVRQAYIARIEAYVRDIMSREQTEKQPLRADGQPGE